MVAATASDATTQPQSGGGVGFPGVSPVISHDQLRKEAVLYFGPAEHGVKLHRGFNIESAVLRGNDAYITAVCGCDMQLSEPSRRLPLNRIRELCRRCFGGSILEALAGYVEMDPVGKVSGLMSRVIAGELDGVSLIPEFDKLVAELRVAENVIYDTLPPLTDAQIDRWLDRTGVPLYTVS